VILDFSNKTKHQKDALVGEGYFYLQEAARLGKSLVISEEVEKKTPKQHKGYFRLCSLLVPYFQKEYGQICDKDFVSDTAKLSAGYSNKVGKQVVPKSLTKATLEEMNILIEKLCSICEHFGLKSYELTNAETQALLEFFNKKERTNAS